MKPVADIYLMTCEGVIKTSPKELRQSGAKWRRGAPANLCAELLLDLMALWCRDTPQKWWGIP